MPLVVAAVLAHLAGLVAASRAGALAAVCGAVGLSWLTRGARHRAGRAARAATLGGLALLGAVRGDAAERARRACLALREARDAVTWLNADASPGATVRGEWRVRQCRLPITVRVREGRAAAGAAVHLEGLIVVGGSGLRAIDVAVTPLAPVRAAITRRWRAAINDALDRAFRGGESAAFARALVTGDASLVSPESRDRWADAGLVHMLSVSGLHIAIIVDAVSALLLRIRRPRTQRDLLAVGIVTVYVWVLGAPAPALRAAVTAALSLVARALGRPTDPWAIWAIACAAPLVDARAPLDIGYQLSALGAAGLVIAGAWHRRHSATHRVHDPDAGRLVRWRRRLTRPLRRAIETGIIASLTTLPVVLWVFGRVSVIAPLTNLLAAPVMSVVQPLLFAVVLATPWPDVAAWVATGARATLAVTDAIAVLGAAPPWSTVRVTPSVRVLAALTGTVGLALFSLSGRASRRRSRAMLAAGACALVPWVALLPRRSGACGLHVVDVGQGDALALETGGGRW
nr:ComEC/Rec2 family competence protein [Gemmatimonadaceae bacterium]